jgi:hypothetical protein
MPFYFVLGFILCCCKCQNTFSQWAAEIGILSGNSVSKQGLFERISQKSVDFAKSLLEHILCMQMEARKQSTALFGLFNNVFLQDSTTLRLPKALSFFFAGNTSRGEKKAVARIQSIYNIKHMQFWHFSLCSFTDNDQSAAGLILGYLRQGDLVIRDMGYFVLDNFRKIMDKKAYFISRVKFGVGIFDLSGNELSLKKLLENKKIKDIQVLMGAGAKLPVRLIMIPLSAKQANEKKRKARADRDKRLNHSKEYFKWLDYTIFITNIEDEKWTAKQVAQAYKVRWKIESIFKTWKSNFNLQKILHNECTNVHRVQINIYLLLLFICLFTQKIYHRYTTEIESEHGKIISLVKLSKYLVNNLIAILSLNYQQIKAEIIKHCCYDKRSDRLNMSQLIKLT